MFFLLVTTLVTVFQACSSMTHGYDLVMESINPQPTGGDPRREYVIALIMKTLTNPFFIGMEQGARKAEKELGVKIIVRTGAQETSIEQQKQIVEELTLQKVDAIVIAPGSSTELVGVLKKAQDAGIKIVNIDCKLDANACSQQNLKNVPFISVRNDKAAYQSAKVIADQMTVPCNAFIIDGIRDSDNSQQRVAGAIKAFGEKDVIHVVATVSANWKIDEAYNTAIELFEEYPNTKLVFCANDMMALGVVQYLKETSKKDVFVAGFDNLSETRQAIKDGWIKATVDQNANLQGYMGVETAINLLEGRSVEPIVYIPYKVITYEMLD